MTRIATGEGVVLTNTHKHSRRLTTRREEIRAARHWKRSEDNLQRPNEVTKVKSKANRKKVAPKKKRRQESHVGRLKRRRRARKEETAARPAGAAEQGASREPQALQITGIESE